jgi:predicted RNase H-like nuclease
MNATPVLILLLLPFTLSAQVTLTPMQVRTANVLLDHRDRLIDQARADSLELAAYRTALSQADALQRHTEAMLTETTAQVDRCEAREAQLETALTKASKRGKRWRFIAAVAGVVAVAEGVVIAVVAK